MPFIREQDIENYIFKYFKTVLFYCVYFHELNYS